MKTGKIDPFGKDLKETMTCSERHRLRQPHKEGARGMDILISLCSLQLFFLLFLGLGLPLTKN